jgi:hypothetical protein
MWFTVSEEDVLFVWGKLGVFAASTDKSGLVVFMRRVTCMAKEKR